MLQKKLPKFASVSFSLIGEGGKNVVTTVTVLGVFSLSIGEFGTWNEFNLRSLMLLLLNVMWRELFDFLWLKNEEFIEEASKPKLKSELDLTNALVALEEFDDEDEDGVVPFLTLFDDILL